jgi:hypothetical protein
MALLLGMIVVVAALLVAQWAWGYQTRVLEAIGSAQLLKRLEVRITAVLVHDRSVIVGMRDEDDAQSLRTLVVGIGRERDAVVATLEQWCRDQAHLQLDEVPRRHSVELHHLDDSRTLALRLAA